MGRKKLFTEEEAKKRAKANWYQNQKPKMIEEHNRLASVRFGDDDNILKTKKEKREFKEFVREKNTKRFDEIFNDMERWEKINDSSDHWAARKERQERKKRNGNWVKDADVQRATDVIYGGKSGSIIEDEPEEQYENPYKDE